MSNLRKEHKGGNEIKIRVTLDTSEGLITRQYDADDWAYRNKVMSIIKGKGSDATEIATFRQKKVLSVEDVTDETDGEAK